MRKAGIGQKCPGCGRNLAVKNGLRGDRQYLRCRSQVRGRYLGCELQFTDRAEAYYQRFPAGVIAAAIELYLAGMTYKKIASEVRCRFSIPGAQISEKTVFHWVKTYVDIAVEAVWELTIDSSEGLSVEWTSLYPADGGCWAVQDLDTSYILVAEIGGLFDPDTAREVIDKSGASSRLLPERVYIFTSRTVEDSGNPEAFSNVLAAIEQEFPFLENTSPVEMSPEDTLILGRAGAFRDALRTLRKRGAFRSPESRQRFLHGWRVMHNFLTDPDDPAYLTPAEHAGVEAPFRSWVDVVNHRVKVASKDRGGNKEGALE